MREKSSPVRPEARVAIPDNGPGSLHAPDADPVRRRRLRVAIKFMLFGALAVSAWVLLGFFFDEPEVRPPADVLQVDLSRIEAGKHKMINWDGRPVIVMHRTAAQLAILRDLHRQSEVANQTEKYLLADPGSLESDQPAAAQNPYRSIDSRWFVALALGTDYECSLIREPAVEMSTGDSDSGWPGGFRDACRGSRYDLAGRVFADQFARRNITIPDYRIEQDTLLLGAQPD